MNQFVKMWGVRVLTPAQPGDVVEVTKASGETTTVVLAALVPGETNLWLITRTPRTTAVAQPAAPVTRLIKAKRAA